MQPILFCMFGEKQYHLAATKSFCRFWLLCQAVWWKLSFHTKMCRLSFRSRYAWKDQNEYKYTETWRFKSKHEKISPKKCYLLRTFPGRSHSAAHSINHGPGESIYKLCRVVGSPIQVGTRVCRALYQQQKVNERHKQRKNQKITRRPEVESGALCTSCTSTSKNMWSMLKICYCLYKQRSSAVITIIPKMTSRKEFKLRNKPLLILNNMVDAI